MFTWLLTGLTLFDPGGEGLLEVLVRLECHRSAHLGGQNHFGSRGDLAGEGADHDLGGGGDRGGRAASGCARVASAAATLLKLQTFLKKTKKTSDTVSTPSST